MSSWKPMVEFKGKPLIRTVVERARCVCNRIIVVCGYRGDEIEEYFARDTDVTCVRNTVYRRGMFSSIQTGAVLVETDWFFIMMGDMPVVPAELFHRLAQQIKLHPEADIIRPLCRNTPGHPVLLKRSVAETIGELDHNADMQAVFTEHEKKTGQMVFALHVDDIPECIRDFDTDEDLIAEDPEKLTAACDREEEG